MGSSQRLRDGPDIHGGSFCQAALAIAFQKRTCADLQASEQLRPHLKAVDLTLIGVGASVGSGIFVIAGVAAVPTGPAVCISFLIAALSSVFSAMCYAELAARIPVSGNVYLYAYVAFGEIFAVLFGLNLLVDFHVGAALGTLSCATYLRNALEAIAWSSWLPSPEIFAVLLMVLLTATLCAGVEKGLKRANGVLVSAKVAIVLLIIAVGIGKADGGNLVPFMPFGFGPVASMSTTCCFSYIGFGTVASAAEECVNPQRDLPIGITASLVICALLYVSFSLVLCGIVPFREIDKAAPVDAAFGPKYANIPWIGVLVNWGAIIGIYTTLLTGLYSQARMYLAISRDGLIFDFLRYVSPRFGTPVKSQIFCGAIAAFLATCLPLDRLIRYLNIGVLSSYTIVCAGVLVLRADRPAAAAISSAVLSVTSVVAPVLAELIAAAAFFADRAALRVVIYISLTAIVCATWVALMRQSYARPSSFACPLCPLLPALGITFNGYLLSQCHWEAWVRLGLTTMLVLVAYGFRVTRMLPANRESEPEGIGLS